MLVLFEAIAVWLAVVLVTMLVITYLARRWGHDPFGWLLLTAAMGPIALVALVGTRQRNQELSHAGGARTAPPDGQVVLAACDGSETGARIGKYLAETFGPGAKVVLLVVEPHESEPRTPAEEQQAQQRAEKTTAGAREPLRAARIASRTAIAYGSAGEEIVRVADAERAWVIVVGRRGAGLSRALLGSVSEHVVKNARQPVVVVS
ncbi:MAG: universal stress protein [Chloroflexi bacterium]|nr:universal stress protein [Chloroflexota bacterium]